MHVHLAEILLVLFGDGVIVLHCAAASPAMPQLDSNEPRAQTLPTSNATPTDFSRSLPVLKHARFFTLLREQLGLQAPTSIVRTHPGSNVIVTATMCTQVADGHCSFRTAAQIRSSLS